MHMRDAAAGLLRLLPPEQAHRLALAALRLGLAGRAPPADPVLGARVMGLEFPSVLGVAAGFDKNAVAVRGLLRLGFGFVEVGTVTPLPQAGNAQPRLFRLAEDRAVINRLGFNGEGAVAVEGRLARLRAGALPGLVGVNLGINKVGAVPVRDYPALGRRLGPLADYLVINVSSPNTPGLRDLQGERVLGEILAAMPSSGGPPLLVKLAPDLAEAALEGLVELCVGAGVAGLVISNTTIARPDGLQGVHRGEAGGLSGAPLFARSTEMLARARRLAGGRLVLVGVGGVSGGAEALAKIKAGADLVQAYTGFAYEGAGFAARVGRELAAELRAEGFASVAAAVGVAA